MKRIYLVYIVAIIIGSSMLFNTQPAKSYSGGPPSNLTGSPGNGGATCTNCHSPGVASGVSQSITSNIPIGGYTPGSTYTITATCAGINTSGGGTGNVFGFEVSPQNSSGTQLGTLIITDVTNTQLTGVNYVTHTLAGTTGTSNARAWSFDWTAPATGTGTVTFYGAFNIANGDGNSTSDVIHTATLVVQEASSPVAGVSISSNPVITPTSLPICPGSVTFTATPTNGGTTPSYQWKVNGTNIGTNSPTFIDSFFNNGSTVTCVMTSNLAGVTGSPATSNALNVQVSIQKPTIIKSGNVLTSSAGSGNQWYFGNTPIGGATSTTYTVTQSGTYYVVVSAGGCSNKSDTIQVNVAGVAITSNPVITPTSLPICPGSVTFTATPTNGGTTPSYQWKVNGTNIGTNSPTFIDSFFNNGSTVTCVMTSNLAGVTGSPATSNALNVQVSIQKPTIIKSGNVLTSSVGSGNQWYLGNTPIGGATSTTYTVTQSGTYYVVVSTGGCSNKSDTIQVNVAGVAITSNPVITPTSLPICPGSVTFTATPTNGGTTPSYQWEVNGTNIGTNSLTFVDSFFNNGSTVTCVMTSNLPGVTGSPATSNAIAVRVTPQKPLVTKRGGDTLTSSASGGNQWYMGTTSITGATSQIYIATQSGTYRVIVTSAGCPNKSDTVQVTITGINDLIMGSLVKVYPNPFSSVVNVEISAETKDLANWNVEVMDVTGRKVYSSNALQNSNRIDLSDQESGVYFITVKDGAKQSNYKVMKGN